MRLRTVLLAIVAVSALLAPVRGQSLPATQPDTTPVFHFAAITDTHIAHPAELAKFRNFLLTIRDAKPDFLLILGDVCGHAPEYLPQIREVIEHSGLTVYVIPGNHDDNYGKNNDWFNTAFKPNYTFDHKGWHFVMSDSQSPPPADWLPAQLAAPASQPTVYCQHYPPAPKQTPDDLPWAELARHPNVKTVLTGHWHQRNSGRIGPVGYEVLANCFFTSQPKDGHYYLVDALPDGRTRIKEYPLNNLKLREPADAVPSVTVRQPHDGDILRNGTLFAGAATDDKALKRIEYSIDFGAWQPAKGTRSWEFKLNTESLADGHHLFRVRAIDSADQATIDLGTVLAMVENHPPQPGRVFRLQQGLEGYQGCRDATVRKPDSPKSPSGEEGNATDLECWTSKDGKGEFCEFYIRFDLAKAGIPAGATIKRATLTLFGSRQNQVDDQGKLCRYFLGVLAEPWKTPMTFQTRPAQPAWFSPLELDPKPALTGAWPYLGGRQLPMPPQPVVIDLTPLRETVQHWLADPASNHGLVVSPAGGRTYNMSTKGTGYAIPTLRPKLEIEIE